MSPAIVWKYATSYALETDLTVEEAKISQAYIEMIGKHVDRDVEELRNNVRYGEYDGRDAASLARDAD